ncbi:hypothetical protein DEFR109230_14645 [Deinococcus frigens]
MQPHSPWTPLNCRDAPVFKNIGIEVGDIHLNEKARASFESATPPGFCGFLTRPDALGHVQLQTGL